LFNALEVAIDLDGAFLLDLYAGSGALGFEALSRGAAGVTFVESDAAAVRVLRRNADMLGLPGARIMARTVEQALAEPADRPYDVILADPPYAVGNDRLTGVLRSVLAGSWLVPDGLVLLERAARDGEPDWPDGLTALRTRRYGDTAVHWLRTGCGGW
jgi:16S rRNA (guanine966-N2)-methyltransferase